MTRPARLARIAAAAMLAGALLAGCAGDEEPEGFRESPMGTVLSFHAAGPETVFAVTDAARTCPSCANLWKWRKADQEWRRVHDFPEPARAGYDDGAGPFPPLQPDALAMAPDGVHGWFRWSNDPTLMVTRDGGGSWQPAVVPWERATVVSLLVDAPYVFATTQPECATDACGHDLWRTEIGFDAWRLVDWPAGAAGFDLGARRGVLTVAEWNPGSLAGYRSARLGEGWEKVTGPEGATACRLQPGFVAEVVVCAPDRRADRDRLYVRTQNGAWRELRLPAPRKGALRVSWLISGDERSFVVGTDRGVVVTSTDGEYGGVGQPLRRSDQPAVRAFVNERVAHLLANQNRVLRTEDGGRTWTEISDDPAT